MEDCLKIILFILFVYAVYLYMKRNRKGCACEKNSKGCTCEGQAKKQLSTCGR